MLETVNTTAKALLAVAAVLGAAALVTARQAQAAPPDVGGNYRCQPNPLPCLWVGQTPSITQTGTGLVIKNDKGEVAAAKLTSDITISAGGPLNSYGVIRSDHAIDWSNGNTWRKQ